MEKIWIFFTLISISIGVQAVQIDEDSSFPDYWQDDYEWYSGELEKLGILDTEVKSSKELKTEGKTTLEIQNIDQENDRKVAEEIEKYRNDNEAQITHKNVESENNLLDYQFEDNRSEVDDNDEKEDTDLTEDKAKEFESIEDELQSIGELAEDIADLNRIKESLQDDKEVKTDLSNKKNDQDTSNLDPESIDNTFDIDTDDITASKENSNKNKTTDNEEVFLETEKILKDDENEDFLEMQSLPKDQTNLDNIVEETRKILEATNDKLDENIKGSEPNIELKSQQLDKIIEIDEDDLKNFDEAYDDLVDNWDKLSENWDQIKSNDDKENVLNDEEIDYLYKKLNLGDDYENIDDENIESLLSPFELEKKVKTDVSTEKVEPMPDDTKSEENEAPNESHAIEYLHDALLASDVTDPDAEIIGQRTTSNPVVDTEIASVSSQGENKKEKSASTSSSVEYIPLSESEYERVMDEFKVQHKEDFNVKSKDFDKHVAPIHITISEEPVIVTSPNYPSNYPTNNIIDWIFQGEGEGIELNITDFAVNGHLGDYLLVKPGGVDASGNEGLIFSYTLSSERRYRFMDVNRMFVRFEAKPGMQFMKGFSFSVKLLRHIPFETEPQPTPEPVIVPPHSTITLNLGGTTLENFVQGEIEEEFRRIVADMATMYINSNNIDPGLNTTLEVTQIVSRALCYHNWPKFENCVEVKFGVPLEYDGDQEPRLDVDDLNSMWVKYFDQDPFASRLRRLGITEYQAPNDTDVLMVWLVIAAGVLISMASMAFALWRFSCFENYTRMPSFSDTDSLQEKRNLDLYPTPHQMLPPLYSENEYKWVDAKHDDSTRVDMGGFANKNYVRDDLYDFDSDEDVVAARDRYTTDV
ncbi:unnamed protein product [Parnassius apollo]|uniref:(apollo) hypothetical protein n=1 Tax=Parnassius apollo TaxID=110799 RepID=A0A8S3X9R7_PARAO|nr:unnamed protein product [Parnassius apollo]